MSTDYTDRFHAPVPKLGGVYRYRPRNLGLGRRTLADREAALRRLDELLRIRADQRFRDHQGDQTRPPSHEDGFTLIELLLVLLIVMILLGLGLGVLHNQLRRSAVDDATANIMQACDTARQLALLDNGKGNRFYGVEITDSSGSKPAKVAVVEWQRGRIQAAEGEQGAALFEVSIPAGVVLWQGDKDLRSRGDGSLRWFYGNGTGQTHEATGNGLSAYPVAVGQVPQRFQDVWEQTDNSGEQPMIAPGDTEHPGLAVRTVDGEYGVALQVQTNGVVMKDVLKESK